MIKSRKQQVIFYVGLDPFMKYSSLLSFDFYIKFLYPNEILEK